MSKGDKRGARGDGSPSKSSVNPNAIERELVSADTRAWTKRSLANRMSMIEKARQAARASDQEALQELLDQGLRVENLALLLFSASFSSSVFFERLIKAWPSDALPLSDSDGFGWAALKQCASLISGPGASFPVGESFAGSVVNKLLALKRIGVAYDSDQGAPIVSSELASSAVVPDGLVELLKPLRLRVDEPVCAGGLTPLAWCVRSGNTQRSLFLVELGANTSLARLDEPGGYEGRSPLAAAIRLRQWHKVRLYLAWGADPKKARIDAPGLYGETELSLCLKEGDFEGVRALMEMGANPRAKGPQWEMALFSAGRQRNGQRGVLEFKALIEARDLAAAAGSPKSGVKATRAARARL